MTARAITPCVRRPVDTQTLCDFVSVKAKHIYHIRSDIMNVPASHETRLMTSVYYEEKEVTTGDKEKQLAPKQLTVRKPAQLLRTNDADAS